jgi:hypothetical protein
MMKQLPVPYTIFPESAARAASGMPTAMSPAIAKYLAQSIDLLSILRRIANRLVFDLITGRDR